MCGPGSRDRRFRATALVTILIAVVVLTASCTGEDDAPDNPTRALEYAELLRASNNLAHGSLEIPASATLPKLSAVARIYRAIGSSPVVVGDADLGRLVRQSSEPPLWKLQSLCDIQPDIGVSLGEFLSDEESAEMRDLVLPAAVTITTADSVAEFLTIVGVSRCVGSKLDVTEAQKTAILDAARSYPLVAAQAVTSLNIDASETEPLVTGDNIEDLAGRIVENGCTDWAMTESLAIILLSKQGLTEAGDLHDIEECAQSSAIAVDDVESLPMAVQFGLPVDTARGIVRDNQPLLDQLVRLTSTFATEPGRPVGQGSVAATRGLVQYLRLNDVTSFPQWIRDGVLSATRSEQSDADSVDLLHLCESLNIACGDAFIQKATAALSQSIGTIDFTPAQDEGAARMVETALLVGLEIPVTCERSSRELWFDQAPQTLAVLASADKMCADTGMYSEEELRAGVSASLDELDPQRALAFVYLHMLSDPSASDPDFAEYCDERFGSLWTSLSESEGSDYLAQARPLSVELVKAKINNWTST